MDSGGLCVTIFGDRRRQMQPVDSLDILVQQDLDKALIWGWLELRSIVLIDPHLSIFFYKGQYEQTILFPSNSYAAGSGQIWLSNVGCTSSSSDLLSCSFSSFVFCNHQEDVGLRCSEYKSQPNLLCYPNSLIFRVKKELYVVYTHIQKTLWNVIWSDVLYITQLQNYDLLPTYYGIHIALFLCKISCLQQGEHMQLCLKYQLGNAQTLDCMLVTTCDISIVGLVIRMSRPTVHQPRSITMYGQGAG